MSKELVQKPTLTIARKLFKRKNPNIDFNVSWKRKPTFINNSVSYTHLTLPTIYSV